MSTKNKEPVWNGPIKIVDEDSLSHWTEKGWVLVEKIQEEVQLPVTDQMPRGFALPESHWNYSGDDGTVMVSKNITVTHTRFLIGLPLNSALARVTRERDEANVDLVKSEGVIKELMAQIGTMQKELERARPTSKSEAVQVG